MGRRKSIADEEDRASRDKRLKVQLAQCKSKLTKAENFLREQKGPLDTDAITLRLQLLEKVLLTVNDLLLEKQVLTWSDDDEFDDDGLEERCLSVIISYKKALAQASSSKQNTSASDSASDRYSSMKLPEIDIPVYEGKDYTKYQSFIELFTAIIHRNGKLEPIQKLFYLRKYLKGEPLSLIEGLPLTGDSYEKALALLKARYDNKFLVVTNHVQAILDFSPIVKGAASNLRELIAHARQHLGALKTLGQPTEHWDMIILPILLRKIDQFSCRAYHSERVDNKLPNLDDFFAFIERRASSFEESQRSEDRHIWVEVLQLSGHKVPGRTSTPVRG
ncbi:uncharacterized protein LOC126382130 [Pectinophora gossypiella]|uniref:uncharacterized protein LOC126366636 n=1 Tax=Pectinophora gossypiella TaxID=13191 RepID=UPI00214E05AA|nr:uncharacterized protein LOC126366636 [Pectinophora gossypiella]XP_049869267.1 uncharacterized protein LOC126369031 [Pectinophora gossypiella]XP_049872775.1 uncharacterized protein LOC126371504 [Pectinophora gossypiella]XP_049881081.1 uncharacterized protein LOC126377391 [Pectinophora gossypiella]XP_049881346.1 uncharacterized protein LOC126377580 [Pectinophora gossypiella]XP_049881518.1 uncharacterized protein LOC126377751 [Pectinophora gossypiella]XP_049887850.1 uncharacterized protein LO